MSSRRSLLLDLARVMIKQAKLLKHQGLIAEARSIALRAIELNHLGHAAMRAQPVEIASLSRRRG
ncbi:hypothetical protein [Oricola sp.]|uniref:hypothetical protein n=1 Tax=Oricola sp. TaxID=1979950 RepID=UPI003BA9E8BB